MAGRAAKPPRFYFNLRSPYNFFALHDLERDHPELLDRLAWHPFWEPDETSAELLERARGQFPYTPMTRAKQFYILRDVRRLAAARGLALTWPADRAPWWEPAHLTWFLAVDAGLGREWVARAGRARWLEGRDICDPDTVLELAVEIGLDADAVKGATDNAELRERATAALLNVQRDGVFGVPYFINGSEPYWGLDRVAEFAASFRDAEPVESAAPAEAELAVVGAGRTTDMSHAGGCG
ncbi:DsbA family protein [Streptomyces sp. RerS4]|uniref:2-hydroxychromene-2-carboxylate isomerase n=1 Tax=Streptomyces sp. RerS4 TaxID=2942449 RepID=UPI00201C3352|nr:DsbA family protein [Streptomyces sp. RerS4]UQX03484.1 DsbA family protein [Streptomyces sp. RerS4]